MQTSILFKLLQFLRELHPKEVVNILLDFYLIKKATLIYSFKSRLLKNIFTYEKNIDTNPAFRSVKEIRVGRDPKSISYKFPTLYYLIRSKSIGPITSFDYDYIHIRPDVVSYERSPLAHYYRYGYKEGVRISLATLSTKNGYIQINLNNFTFDTKQKKVLVNISNCGLTGITDCVPLTTHADVIVKRNSHLKNIDCVSFSVRKSAKVKISDGCLIVDVELHSNLIVDLKFLEFLSSIYESLKQLEQDLLAYFETLEFFDFTLPSSLENTDANLQSWNELEGNILRRFNNEPRYKVSKPTESRQSRSAIFVSHDNSITGAPKVLLKFKEYLESLGWEVHVIVLMDRGIENIDFGLNTSSFSANDFRLISNSKRQSRKLRNIIDNLIKNVNPEFILVNTFPAVTQVYNLIPGDIFKISYIHELAALTDERMYHPMFMSFDANLYASQASSKSWNQDIKSKTGVVYPNILNDITETNSVPREKLLDSLGIPESHYIFLTVGTLEPRKRQQDIVAAFIKAKLPLSSLVIVGSTDETSALASRYSSSSKNIFVLPKNLNIGQYFDLAHCYVMASELEVYPLVLQEAKSYKRSIICSKYAGFEEMFFDGYPHESFAIGDTDRLAELMQRSTMTPPEQNILQTNRVKSITGVSALLSQIERQMSRPSFRLVEVEENA